MKINIVSKKDQKVKNWAGGTTAQLLIYPEEAEYEKKNFLWRISSATVELEESTFTYLPAFHRILMVLEGNLQIEHKGHHSIRLGPFQQDRFEGEWTTKSYGKATDFNLIMDKSCSGAIEAHYIRKNDIRFLPGLETQKGYKFISESFYTVEGCTSVTIDKNDSYFIQKGDILTIARSAAEAEIAVKINSESEEAIIVRSIVHY